MALPSANEVEVLRKAKEMKDVLDASTDNSTRTKFLHLKAKDLLAKGNVMDAWKVLLM